MSLIYHSLDDVNEKLTLGRYFLIDILRDGIVLFEEPNHPFGEPHPLSPEQALQETKDYFEEWFESADDFLMHNGCLSPDAVQFLLAKYVNIAREQCPSLRHKRVTPHVLRHTTAMELLQAGVDISVIALWLGHESIQSTQVYLHAHIALKVAALA